MLFHISEEAGIARFDPRSSEYAIDPVVWAVDERRLCNYLVPRDCPRVTFYAWPNTSAVDAAHFLGSNPAVVAIESAWLERVRSCRLYGYRMPADTFECLDAGAGYFVSRVPVVPSGLDVFDDPVAELLRRGVELRILRSLWPLRDAVALSTLQFSFIRMRNAEPRGGDGNAAPALTVLDR